eukprot:1641788-Rhodomonas_salina.5
MIHSIWSSGAPWFPSKTEPYLSTKRECSRRLPSVCPCCSPYVSLGFRASTESKLSTDKNLLPISPRVQDQMRVVISLQPFPGRPSRLRRDPLLLCRHSQHEREDREPEEEQDDCSADFVPEAVAAYSIARCTAHARRSNHASGHHCSFHKLPMRVCPHPQASVTTDKENENAHLTRQGRQTARRKARVPSSETEPRGLRAESFSRPVCTMHSVRARA